LTRDSSPARTRDTNLASQRYSLRPCVARQAGHDYAAVNWPSTPSTDPGPE
jgi:hypothetical protein